MESELNFINLHHSSTPKRAPIVRANGIAPLLIKDILKITFNDDFCAVRTLFGQQFKNVMFYGLCTSQKTKNEKIIYTIEDETAKIEVVFDPTKHNTGITSLKSTIINKLIEKNTNFRA